MTLLSKFNHFVYNSLVLLVLIDNIKRHLLSLVIKIKVMLLQEKGKKETKK